jgi:hypothetical protein
MARVLSSNQSRGAWERYAAMAIGGLGAVIACIVIAACGARSPIVSAALVVPTATALTPTLPVTVQVAYTITGTATLNISGSTLPNASIGVSKGAPVSIFTATANASGNFVVHLTGIALGMTTYGLIVFSPGYSWTLTQFTVTRKS